MLLAVQADKQAKFTEVAPVAAFNRRHTTEAMGVVGTERTEGRLVARVEGEVADQVRGDHLGSLRFAGEWNAGRHNECLAGSVRYKGCVLRRLGFALLAAHGDRQ
ncbi:hypothetical protein D9M70_515180 [compost metagenome]